MAAWLDSAAGAAIPTAPSRASVPEPGLCEKFLYVLRGGDPSNPYLHKRMYDGLTHENLWMVCGGTHGVTFARRDLNLPEGEHLEFYDWSVHSVGMTTKIENECVVTNERVLIDSKERKKYLGNIPTKHRAFAFHRKHVRGIESGTVYQGVSRLLWGLFFLFIGLCIVRQWYITFYENAIEMFQHSHVPGWLFPICLRGPCDQLISREPAKFQPSALLEQHSFTQGSMKQIVRRDSSSGTGVAEGKDVAMDMMSANPSATAAFASFAEMSFQGATLLHVVNETPEDPSVTLPDANATLPDANATLSDANATLSDANATLLDANVTLPDVVNEVEVTGENDTEECMDLSFWADGNAHNCERYMQPGWLLSCNAATPSSDQIAKEEDNYGISALQACCSCGGGQNEALAVLRQKIAKRLELVVSMDEAIQNMFRKIWADGVTTVAGLGRALDQVDMETLKGLYNLLKVRADGTFLQPAHVLASKTVNAVFHKAVSVHEKYRQAQEWVQDRYRAGGQILYEVPNTAYGVYSTTQLLEQCLVHLIGLICILVAICLMWSWTTMYFFHHRSYVTFKIEHRHWNNKDLRDYDDVDINGYVVPSVGFYLSSNSAEGYRERLASLTSAIFKA